MCVWMLVGIQYLIIIMGIFKGTSHNPAYFKENKNVENISKENKNVDNNQQENL